MPKARDLSSEASDEEADYDGAEFQDQTRRTVALVALWLYGLLVVAYSLAIGIAFFFGKPGRDLADAGLAMTGPLGAIVGGMVGYYFARTQ